MDGKSIENQLSIPPVKLDKIKMQLQHQNKQHSNHGIVQEGDWQQPTREMKWCSMKMEIRLISGDKYSTQIQRKPSWKEANLANFRNLANFSFDNKAAPDLHDESKNTEISKSQILTSGM